MGQFRDILMLYVVIGYALLAQEERDMGPESWALGMNNATFDD